MGAVYFYLWVTPTNQQFKKTFIVFTCLTIFVKKMVTYLYKKFTKIKKLKKNLKNTKLKITKNSIYDYWHRTVAAF